MADPVRILILDPDDRSASDCIRAFAGRGWMASRFRTFQEAEASLVSDSYEIAMIDLILPDVDGTEAWSRVRAMDPDTLGIITTSSPSLHNSIIAAEKGILAYLQKPLRLPALCTLISESLNYQSAGTKGGNTHRQMAGLCQLISSLGHSNDRDLILKNALAHLPAVLKFDVAAVYLLDEKRSSWTRFIQHRPFPHQIEFADAQSEFVQNLVLEAIHSLQPQALLRSDVPDRSGRRLRLQELGFSDLLLAPIMSPGDPCGALTIICGLDSDLSFTPYEVDLLSIVSQALGLALDRSRVLYQLGDGSIHDQETGAYSAAYLAALVQIELARLKRHGRPFCLILIDSPSPGLRSEDDTEDALSRTQREVAEVARSIVRLSDIVATLPSWKVAILLPETTQEDAGRMLERVKRGLESRLSEKAGAPVRPVKVQVVSATPEAQDLGDLLDIARG